jgi:hypothetical protein
MHNEVSTESHANGFATGAHLATNNAQETYDFSVGPFVHD